MAGKGLGGKNCPSMEEGLGVVAAQSVAHPPPADLDATIAVSWHALYAVYTVYSYIYIYISIDISDP